VSYDTNTFIYDGLFVLEGADERMSMDKIKLFSSRVKLFKNFSYTLQL
jgi:inosine/xanthosine triphosphate pyrophosphatase family protein